MREGSGRVWESAGERVMAEGWGKGPRVVLKRPSSPAREEGRRARQEEKTNMTKKKKRERDKE